MDDGGEIMDSLSRSATVALTPGDAYRLFVEDFGRWWPTDYTFSQDQLAEIGIDGVAGGRCYERDRQGREWIWGTVVSAEPPNRLIFRWQITGNREIEADPGRASEVEVTFTADGADRTVVTLEHRQFARHGEGWRDYLEGMASDQGWTHCLALYEKAASAESMIS